MSQSSAPPSPAVVFPERLRTAREYRGLNQAELATKAGLQPSAISHFETGARKPSFDNLHLLADALDVTIDYLLGRVADFKALAGADQLHRHYDELSGSDRKMADDMITMLAARAKERDKGKS
ncbi:transcriptional regulator with XRE-family HTH domain [Variovorax paradoxus]|uniref:Transcriptional regulator with XRE-family HTH domain n=1 Tax=Variovorax paradoxus TaxID=34073 RepID=A0AAW8ENW7_VARPD|nr:helix-turn-helix transcriptional regulator [Variovorax paradoxus]MDP9974561.1 transcriptional regulator with XRE-family HTH domain [Variovorax paradoxus]